MAKFKKFLKQQAHDVYWGEGNPDTPICPNCRATMEFHGGSLSFGDGYWDCTDCDYTFTESNLREFDVSDYFD